jgi:hypothetical protein
LAKVKGNILVLTYWDFNEAHIQANVLPNLKILSRYVDSGSIIYLFCFNKRHLSKEDIRRIENELSAYRIRLICFDYTHFGLKMILRYGWLIPFLCVKIFTKRINSVYAWCTTAGAIGYLISVITRRTLILESYEPHAGAMVENGYWGKRSLAYRVLSFFERKQAQRATFVIAANAGMREYVKQRYDYVIPADIFFAKPACVNLEEFYPDLADRKARRNQLGYAEDDVVCVYAGKFGGIYLREETFYLIRSAYDFFGERLNVLLLTAHSKDEVKELCEKTGVPFRLFTVLLVKHNEVPSYLRAGDFALCPVKPVPTKKYCTPVKDGEYWATGLPVIITRDISDDSLIIENNNAGAVLQELTETGYRAAIAQISNILQGDRGLLSARIRFLAEQHRNYKISEYIYNIILRGGIGSGQ